MRHAALGWAAALVCVNMAASGAASESPADAAGVRAGLCVHVPATDGLVEIELARGGRRLVHGLALDGAALAKSRAAIRAAGLHPLATVEPAGGPATLPYADNLVNLLIVDLDRLGATAPPREEILRVLAPRGVARLRQGGAWSRLVKPVPAAMDDWTHFDYGPEGNGVSRDRLVRPPTSVQWIRGETFIAPAGHPSRRVPASIGLRISGGRVFYQWERGREKRTRQVLYAGRDAFNGLPLWDVPAGYDSRTKRFQFVAAGGFLYAFLTKGGPLVAIDAATGEVARTYDQGCRLPEDAKQSGDVEIRRCGGRIIQTCGAELLALDADSGRRLWRHGEKAGRLCFPVATAAGGKVFVAVADKQPYWGRWPHTVVRAIVCLALADGREIWRNTEVAGGDIGQLVYDGGSLAVFGSGAIGGGDKPYIGAIRVRDGRLLFHRTFRKNYNRFGYNLLVRDGVMYYADAWRIYAVDMATGDETRPYALDGYNQRCNRFSATADWFLFGLVTYVDRSFAGRIQSVTRSGCALGAFPAHGLVFFTPNGCGCVPGQLRGHMALSPEPIRPAVADDRRLRKAPGGTLAGTGAPPSPPAGRIADDWRAPGGVEATETQPVRAGGRQVVAVIHEHRLECRRDGGQVVWSFTAGGRISSPPVVRDGLCLFGCHDGWVYCLRADRGECLWRFQAAPCERRIVVNGQLESSWPVYGVTMHQGRVCFSAGLHPELGGGIYVYGLVPRTGSIAWRKVLRRAPVVYKGERRFRMVPNRVLNAALTSSGKTLSLPGVAFDPMETEDAINARIAAPPVRSTREARRGK